ncbi:MAG: nucleotidyltransferase family protein, partial [Pseudomonadota bacterium]
GGSRGNPVLFPASLARRIREEGGTLGCRRFLDDNPALVQPYAAPNDHFLQDVDTPEDARRLRITNT